MSTVFLPTFYVLNKKLITKQVMPWGRSALFLLKIGVIFINLRESNFDSPKVMEKLEERLHRDFTKVENE